MNTSTEIAAKRSTFSMLLRPANWPAAIGLGIIWCLRLLPFPMSVQLGKAIGNLLYLIPSSRRHIAMVNIERCLPELSPEQRRTFCRQVFQNYGAGLIETGMAWWTDTAELQTMLEFEGLDALERARADGSGILLIGAHFSTLDIGCALAKGFFEYRVVYKEQKGELFNHVMVQSRLQFAKECIDNHRQRDIIRYLRDGDVIWFGPDQDMGESHSVFAPFFGQSAATIKATSRLAKLGRAKVMMYGQYRKPDNSGYRIVIGEPLANFPSGDDILDATAVNQMIETAIRKEPTQYYWFHRRFKTQADQPRGALYKRHD